jgi:two-component system copper resistance phosphate regulon response regulator CusR
MRLLLVEDEPLFGKRLRKGLQEESYAVDLAPTGADADEQLHVTDYDLVILDLMLPDRTGIDLLEGWRSTGFEAPVLILTARDQLDDKLAGFKAGADDYLIKPFEFEELLARVQSLLRRPRVPLAEVLRCADLSLDRSRRYAERAGRPLKFTSKEFALLEYLLLHQGAVLTRLQIAEHVWDSGYEARSNVIDVIVGRIRTKLEEHGAPRLLHTVKGVGFVLNDSLDEEA